MNCMRGQISRLLLPLLPPNVSWDGIWIINNDGWIRIRIFPSMPWVFLRSQLPTLLGFYRKFLYLQGLDKDFEMVIYISKLR